MVLVPKDKEFNVGIVNLGVFLEKIDVMQVIQKKSKRYRIKYRF
jgi:hypothetical protein